MNGKPMKKRKLTKFGKEEYNFIRQLFFSRYKYFVRNEGLCT